MLQEVRNVSEQPYNQRQHQDEEEDDENHYMNSSEEHQDGENDF